MKPSVVLLLLGVVAPRIAQAGDCVGSCIGIKDGDYRSCRGCEVYVTCSHGNLHDGRPCPGKLVWNDELKQCSTLSRTCTSGNPAGRRYKAPGNPPNIPAQYGPDSNVPYGPPFVQHSPTNTYSRSLERQAPYPADSFPPPSQAHPLPLPSSPGFPRIPDTAPQEYPQPQILPGRRYSSHDQPPPGFEPLPAPPSKGSYKISNFPPSIPYPAVPYQSQHAGSFLPNSPYPDLPYPPVNGFPGPSPPNSPHPDLPYPPNNPEQKSYAPDGYQPDLPYPPPNGQIVGPPYSPRDKNSHPKDGPLQKLDPRGIQQGQEYPPGSGQKDPYPPKQKPSSGNPGGPYPSPINEPSQYPPSKENLHQSNPPYPGVSSKGHQAPYPPKSQGKGLPYPIPEKQPGQYPTDQYPDQSKKAHQAPYPPKSQRKGSPYPIPEKQPGQYPTDQYPDQSKKAHQAPYPPKSQRKGLPYPIPEKQPGQYPTGQYPDQSKKAHQAPYPPKSQGKGLPYAIPEKQPGHYPTDQYPDQGNKGQQEPYSPSDEYPGKPYPPPNGKSESYPSSVPGPSRLPPHNTGESGPYYHNTQYPAPPFPAPKRQLDTYPPNQGQPYLPSNEESDWYPPKNTKSSNNRYLDEPYPPLRGQPGPVPPTSPGEPYPPHTGLIAPYPPFPRPDQRYPNIQEPSSPPTFRSSKQQDNNPLLYPPSFSGRVPDSLGIGRPAVRSGVCIKDCTFVTNGDYQSCTGCHFYATCTGGYLYDNRPCPAYLCWDDNKKRCERQSPTCDCRK